MKTGRPTIDITGQVFGELIAIEPCGRTENGLILGASAALAERLRLAQRDNYAINKRRVAANVLAASRNISRMVTRVRE